MNPSIKIGLVSAAISLLFSLGIATSGNYSILFSGKMMLISFILSMAILIILGRLWLRDPERGTLTYGEALKGLFIASVVGGFLSMVGGILMFQNNEKVETAFQEYVIRTQESSLKMGMKIGGASEAAIEEKLAELRDDIASGEIETPEYAFSFAQLPLNLLTMMLMSLVYSLIAAIFVKKT